MSRLTLQQWLLAERQFRRAFGAMEEDAVRNQFPALLSARSDYAGSSNWPYLLFCASMLAPSDLPDAEEKALRIAQSALLDPTSTACERDAALIILDSLSNSRSIELAEARGFAEEGLPRRLGISQSIDWVRRSFENRIDLANGKILRANRFQRRFWDAALQSTWLSVSAPTSAGKSFILAQWMTERLLIGAYRRVVYIAPTRALVQQVETDLRVAFRDANLNDIEVSSIPFRSERAGAAQEVLVYTQERLHYFLQKFPAEKIDALIIDEAHKLGDSHRGILLQDVIEQVVAKNSETSVMFTAPLTKNPETLLSDAPEGVKGVPLLSLDATVSQNLLWLQPDLDQPRFWQLLLRRGERDVLLGHFDAGKRLHTIKGRLAKLATLTDTGEGGGILIYANGAARAEEIAEEVALLLPEIKVNRQVQALDELCRMTIHKDYRLRTVLRKGVAFHYGNMPLLLRTAIENLFRDGSIRYLVCTSTLVEGVNLPCRNILVYAPKKGSKTPMSGADFWNLAGRAGRWGKEFQGNVICVDTQDVEAWGETLPTRRDYYRVERTTDRLISEEGRLLAYLRAGAPSERPRSDQDLETAVSYLATLRSRLGSITEAPWRERVEQEKLQHIDAVLEEALAGVDLPAEWLTRHAGISPFAMQRMLTALTGLKGPIDKFIPIHPEDDRSARQYGRIFELLGHYMTGAFGQGGRCHALGILTTNWMLGHPIKRIIKARINWNSRKGITEDTATAIRKTLEDVEQIARFQAPRYLACYSDIMRQALALRGVPELGGQIPDLTLSLEFGVRGPVQLGLMALGLSRSATLAIAEAVTQRFSTQDLISVATNPSVLINVLKGLETRTLKLGALIEAEVIALQNAVNDRV